MNVDSRFEDMVVDILLRYFEHPDTIVHGHGRQTMHADIVEFGIVAYL